MKLIVQFIYMTIITTTIAYPIENLSPCQKSNLVEEILSPNEVIVPANQAELPEVLLPPSVISTSYFEQTVMGEAPPIVETPVEFVNPVVKEPALQVAALKECPCLKKEEALKSEKLKVEELNASVEETTPTVAVVKNECCKQAVAAVDPETVVIPDRLVEVLETIAPMFPSSWPIVPVVPVVPNNILVQEEPKVEFKQVTMIVPLLEEVIVPGKTVVVSTAPKTEDVPDTETIVFPGSEAQFVPVKDETEKPIITEIGSGSAEIGCP